MGKMHFRKDFAWFTVVVVNVEAADVTNGEKHLANIAVDY